MKIENRDDHRVLQIEDADGERVWIAYEDLEELRDAIDDVLRTAGKPE